MRIFEKTFTCGLTARLTFQEPTDSSVVNEIKVSWVGYGEDEDPPLDALIKAWPEYIILKRQAMQALADDTNLKYGITDALRLPSTEDMVDVTHYLAGQPPLYLGRFDEETARALCLGWQGDRNNIEQFKRASLMPTTSVPVKPTTCPHCGRAVDSATSMDMLGGMPGPNSVTICIDCGRMCQVNMEMDLRPLSLSALCDLQQAEFICVLKRALKVYHIKHRTNIMGGGDF